MQQFFPLMWIGFWVNAVSGLLLLVAYPAKALTDPVFYIKIVLITAAVLLLLLVKKAVFVSDDPTRLFEPAKRIKIFAVTILLLWTGAILSGRLIAYTYNIMMTGDIQS